jgi:hypothetical protein
MLVSLRCLGSSVKWYATWLHVSAKVSSYKWEFMIRNNWNWPFNGYHCALKKEVHENLRLYSASNVLVFCEYILCAVFSGNFLTNIPVKKTVQKICHWPVGNDWLRMVYSRYCCRYLYQHSPWWTELNMGTCPAAIIRMDLKFIRCESFPSFLKYF